MDLVSVTPELLSGIKVVYTDLDGTMLGARASFLHAPDGTPTLEPAQALLAAREAGVAVVPTSGRALRGLITDGRMLALPDVIAEMGAQLSYSYGEQIVENFGATPEPGPPARVMEACGAVALLLEHFADHLEHHLPWSRWRECTQLFRGAIDTGDANALLGEHGHDWLELHDNGRLGGMEGMRAYHLQPRGVDKGTAVVLDQQRRGVTAGECIAIGDAVADLALAPHVRALIIVRQAVEEDPDVAAAIEGVGNVAVTDRPQNLGWADVVGGVAAGR